MREAQPPLLVAQVEDVALPLQVVAQPPLLAKHLRHLRQLRVVVDKVWVAEAAKEAVVVGAAGLPEEL